MNPKTSDRLEGTCDPSASLIRPSRRKTSAPCSLRSPRTLRDGWKCFPSSPPGCKISKPSLTSTCSTVLTAPARPTFLDDRPHGVFASRHPSRPNQIGLSVVRLLERQGDTLLVQGIDVLDQTPLLDIKPYMPGYDAIKDATMGGRPGSVGVPSPEAASEEDSFDYGFLRTGLPATRGLLDGIRTTSARHQTILPLPRGLNCRPGRHSRNSAKAAGRSGDESR